MANINELLLGLGYAKNVDIATVSASPLYWRLPNLNPRPWAQSPVVESDAGEVGKGHEFATTRTKSHYENGTYQFQQYASSELLAWALAFCLGKVVKSGTTPNFTYTITPLNPATDGLEPPYLPFVQQIRPGGSSVLDQLFPGCAIKSVRLTVNNAPGRASAMLSIELINTGVCTEPSVVTLPAPAVFHEFIANSLTLTIAGVDYVASKSWESLEIVWDNMFRPGWFPGNTFQDGFATQGRFEVGDRQCGFSFVVRYANGSTELTKLRALTTGTAVIGLSYDSNNSLAFTWQKMGFRVVEIGNKDGIVTVGVTGDPLYDSTNGVCSAVVKVSGNGNICQ